MKPFVYIQSLRVDGYVFLLGQLNAEAFRFAVDCPTTVGLGIRAIKRKSGCTNLDIEQSGTRGLCLVNYFCEAETENEAMAAARRFKALIEEHLGFGALLVSLETRRVA